MTITSLQSGKWYSVVEDWVSSMSPDARLKSCCYELLTGAKVQFEGKSLGLAMLRTEDGHQVFIEPRGALAILDGPIEYSKPHRTMKCF